MPNPAPLQHIRLQNLSDLEFNLLRALKIKCDDAVRLPICDFLLVFNSNTYPESDALRDISLQNLSDLGIELSRSLIM